LIVAVLLLAGCETPMVVLLSATPSRSTVSSPTPTAATTGRVTHQLNRLEADEGANGMAFDSSSRATYVATYSGADSINRVSPDGDRVLARYVLPNRHEVGAISSTAGRQFESAHQGLYTPANGP